MTTSLNSSQKKKRRRKTRWRLNKEEQGCEFCGRGFPNLKSGGLEFAHIVAQPYFTKGDPDRSMHNGFMLCPSCHKIFDEVAKKRILACLKWAVTSKSKGSGVMGVCKDEVDFLKKLI